MSDSATSTRRMSQFSANGEGGMGGEASAQYLKLRNTLVSKYFEGSIAVDDFMARVEMELWRNGFTGDNSIAVLNLCRDEICNSLADKVEAVFGEPFNLHGLGAVLTCGVTGIGACLSHAPQVTKGSREKYVFFSFPHVAVNASGELGKVSREGRHDSHACGALLKVQGDLQKQESLGHCTDEDHDVMDPEYTILKQRLERHMVKTGIGHKGIGLHTLTKMAEQAITDDLEKLIRETVDETKADYAVITGIQIHNWSDMFTNIDEPSLEFVQPCKSYVVVNGRRTQLNIQGVPSLTPRMIHLLASVKSGLGLGSSSHPETAFVGDSSSKKKYMEQRKQESGYHDLFKGAVSRRPSLLIPNGASFRRTSSQMNRTSSQMNR